MSEAKAVQGGGNGQGTDDDEQSASRLRLVRQEEEAAEGTVEGAPSEFAVDPPEEAGEIPEEAFGVLAVVTVPVQAEVFLNDQPIGVAPLQVRVLPGEYVMKVRYLGRALYECDITIVEGQATSVPLDFSEPPPSPSPPPRRDPPRAPRRRPMFGYGTLGLIGVAVAVGGFMALRSSGEEEPAPRSELPPTPPPQQMVRRRRKRRFGDVPGEGTQGQATPAAAPSEPAVDPK